MAIYLLLTTINGPVTQTGFSNQIELTAASFAATRVIPQQTKNLANRHLDEVELSYMNISKAWDADSSGGLFQSICKGTMDLTATLSFTSQATSGPLTYLTIKLSNVGLANYALDGDGGAGLPRESITLSYTKIEITPYTAGSNSTPVKGAVVQFDLSTGVAS